jgi:hypothetical protein
MCSNTDKRALDPIDKAVVFWLGFGFWWEHPGVTLGRFFASLAVVDTWGDQPPSGVVGGGPRVSHAAVPPPGGAALTFAPGRGRRDNQEVCIETKNRSYDG